MLALVDCSCARDQEGVLTTYLAASLANRVLLTDAFFMESYKGCPLVNMGKTLRVLRSHLDRVLVCRPLGDLSARTTFSSDGLVDQEQTAAFRQFCNDVGWAQLGHPALTAGVQFQAARTTEMLESISTRLDQLRAHAEHVSGLLSKPVRKAIRETGMTTAVARACFLQSIGSTVTSLLSKRTIAASGEIRSMFELRVILALSLRVHHKIAHSEWAGRSEKDLQNDVLDSFHIAAASYCDSLLSRDSDTLQVHADLVGMLASEWICVLWNSLSQG